MNEKTTGHEILEQILTEFGEQRIPSWDAAALINDAITAEREACAKVADAEAETGLLIDGHPEGNCVLTAEAIAAAIRARGDK